MINGVKRCSICGFINTDGMMDTCGYCKTELEDFKPMDEDYYKKYFDEHTDYADGAIDLFIGGNPRHYGGPYEFATDAGVRAIMDKALSLFKQKSSIKDISKQTLLNVRTVERLERYFIEKGFIDFTVTDYNYVRCEKCGKPTKTQKHKAREDRVCSRCGTKGSCQEVRKVDVDPRCPVCGGVTWKDGMKKLCDGVYQRYKCKSCRKKFTDRDITGPKKPQFLLLAVRVQILDYFKFVGKPQTMRDVMENVKLGHAIVRESIKMLEQEGLLVRRTEGGNPSYVYVHSESEAKSLTIKKKRLCTRYNLTSEDIVENDLFNPDMGWDEFSKKAKKPVKKVEQRTPSPYEEFVRSVGKDTLRAMTVDMLSGYHDEFLDYVKSVDDETALRNICIEAYRMLQELRSALKGV